MITAILNGYKRGKHLNSQIEALERQTIKPKEIMLWQNKGEDFDPDICNKTIWASSNHNFGVWARFSYALNAKTEYVCVFDDDTIPGNRWFENCINTMKTHEGLLGTVGLVFTNKDSYWPMQRPGWPAPNREVVQSDFLGHAWFFKREWLTAFWRELPDLDQPMIVGEDMHFSYTLQKYMGINTYVPPHPPEDLSLWGSIPDSAWKIGQDSNAISMNLENIKLMESQMQKYVDRGWRLLVDG